MVARKMKRCPGNVFESRGENKFGWLGFWGYSKAGTRGASFLCMRIEDFSTDHNITIKPPPWLCISIIFPTAVVQLTSTASLIGHAAKRCINSQ